MLEEVLAALVTLRSAVLPTKIIPLNLRPAHSDTRKIVLSLVKNSRWRWRHKMTLGEENVFLCKRSQAVHKLAK